MSTFKIKSYGKSEFAWLMFPKMKDPSSAQDKLLRWIKKDPRFHKRQISSWLIQPKNLVMCDFIILMRK